MKQGELLGWLIERYSIGEAEGEEDMWMFDQFMPNWNLWMDWRPMTATIPALVVSLRRPQYEGKFRVTEVYRP